jgi:hypothetical protein
VLSEPGLEEEDFLSGISPGLLFARSDRIAVTIGKHLATSEDLSAKAPSRDDFRDAGHPGIIVRRHDP